MSFDVIMSDKAVKQYDSILDYVSYKLKNERAVIGIIDDFDDVITTLENMADSFEYCRSKRLRNLGLRKIKLARYKYLLIYRIKNNQVIVEGMYHELQDYENSM